MQLRSNLYNEIGSELSMHVSKYEQFLQLLEELLANEAEDKIFHSGMTNILNQPEFKDVEKVRTILDLFDESQA